MIRSASRTLLTGALTRVGRLPLTRRAFHRVSVAARGPAIGFLRCRRVLPDTAVGKAHIDRLMQSALFPRELEAMLVDCQRTQRFVHPGEALAALAQGQRLDEGSCVLTFDESFAATFELALPVLRRLRIPALFFVTTEPLDRDVGLWDQDIHDLLMQHAPAPLSVPWIDRVLQTATPQERASALRRVLLSLLALGEPDRSERLAELYDRAGQPPTRPALDRMVTRAELRQLDGDPLVSVGAHGHRHLALSMLDDATLDAELAEPREQLRALLPRAFCDVVSYPFGREPYYDERVIRRAREVGYRAGFTAFSGVCRPGDHLFALPRLAMDRGFSSVDAFELQGVSDAVDELLHILTGTEHRHVAELEG